jgi:CubicO group peptidase (beta-lactamase class C family)
MRRDTIFRIASLTKPIAAAATMLLVDDGVLASALIIRHISLVNSRR